MVLVSCKIYFKRFCCGIFFWGFRMRIMWANSKPKFVLTFVKLKSLTSSPRSYPSNLVGILLFSWSLSEFNRPKIKLSLVRIW
jgi:hypothetical protein